MVATPETRTSQLGVSAVTSGSPTLRVSSSGVMAVALWPAENTRTSQLGTAVVTQAGNTTRLSQLGVMLVARGRVTDPSVRVWGFTLDEHEFYVIRLGMEETIVCDITNNQFFLWGSDESPLWRAYDGYSWLGGTAFANSYGSNVVVGDDGNGSLYFLDPNGDYDDDALQGSEISRPFLREVTGQVLTKGFGRNPCYGVYLLGSIGQEADPNTQGVNLSYSDDRGVSYIDAGTINVAPEAYDDRLHWRSLGSMRQPGRLFKVSDYGALKRIDSLTLEDREA